MSMQDLVSDLITRVKNAQMARHKKVNVQNTKMCQAVANVLLNEGYIKSVKVDDRDLNIELKYHKSEPVITDIKRISKSSLRDYRSKADIPRVNGGLGTAIISTSKGVVSDREARSLGLGGEVICTVY